MFYLFMSSHPHILRFLCTCLYHCILVSLYPYVRVYLLVSSYPYIRTTSGSYAFTCTPASSYPPIGVCLLVTSHLHTLRFMYSGCLQSSQPHIVISLGSCTPIACWYPHILISLGPCTPGACGYPSILISLGSCTPDTRWFSRILTSSYPYVHVLWVLVGILASTHPHMLRFQCLYLFRKLESDKSMVLTKKPAFMETSIGSNKFLTKKYIYNKN